MLKKIKGYELLDIIGRGGMATVYKARQTSLDRLVAIKVLSKVMTSNEEIVTRFNREAILIARLTHPNIIHVIEKGEIDGMHYFVMNFVEGRDYASVLKEGKYDAKAKVDVIIQVCKGLAYAHKNGVIHRDIKPANILIDGDGNALVTDFGIAQLFDKKEEGQGDELTVEGAIMGTIAYMSPEQKVDSGKVTESTDIYSVGVIMYEMFTGTKPLGRFKLPSEINPNFPKPIEQVMLKCLEPDPFQRFRSADELKDVLLKLLRGAHINTTQKKQAFQGIKKMEEDFSLLDVIKDTQHGTVYLFEKKSSNRLMIIKKMRKRKEGLAESKLLAQLEHKNIAKIFGVSGDAHLFIIVMEYINRGTLKDRMIKQFPWREAMKTGRDICEGLAFAHKNDIIHGNLRPSNVFINDGGEVKISDFGLEEHYATDGFQTNWYRRENETQTEQTDVYSVGVILYEMITGSIPVWRDGEFIPNDMFDTLPRKVQRILLGMMELDTSRRTVNIGTIIFQIEELFKVRRKKKKKKGNTRAFFLLGLLVGAGCAYIYLSGNVEYYQKLLEQSIQMYDKYK